MKCFFLISILICSISSFGISPLSSNNKSTLTTIIESKPLKDKFSKEDFIKLRIKDFEKHIGKKLTVKEKIAFKIVQHNLRKEMRTGSLSFPSGHSDLPAGTRQGKLALILSIIGLAAVFIPYVIIASIPLAIIAIVIGNKAKKTDPTDKKARTAVVLGWVTLGLFLIILIIAAVVITFPSWF